MPNRDIDVVKGVKTTSEYLDASDRMFVSQGGVASFTEVAGGILNIYSGGKTRSSWVSSGGSVVVYSGGLASFTTINSTYTSNSGTTATGAIMLLSGGTAIQNRTYPNGKLDVYSGGVASVNYLNGGTMTVSSGGKAVGTDISRNGIASVCSGGIMKNTNISAYNNAGGTLLVFNGGTASKTTVFSGGIMNVSSGGEATSTTMSGGRMIVSFGGKATSTTMSGGSMFVFSGGEAMTTTMSGGSMIVSNGGEAMTTTMSGGSMFVFSGGKANGVTIKNGYVEILSSASMTNLKLSGGILVISSGAVVDTLTNKGGDLQLRPGAVVNNYKGAPLAMPDCDNGWNNYLYNKKLESPLNLNVSDKSPVVLTSATKNIQMDNNGVSNKDMNNFVGYGDEKDFIKIKLNQAATLSFLLSATGSTKFTIWSLTSGTQMKSLQATSLKKNAETGLYQAETKGLLLTSGTYYISMESTNASQGGNAFYKTALSSKSIFYVKGNNFDDGWYNFSEDDYSGSGFLGTVDGKKEVLIGSEWVGYGDEIDFRKFKLNTAAKLVLSIKATDIVSLSICRVDSKTNKNEIVTFSLKTLQSATAKKTEEDSSYPYFASTKSILLDPGCYYIRVESKNAKTGGSADYTVSLNTDESVFFNKGNHEDDWTDKGKGWKANKNYEYEIKNTSTLISNEWVGYNDEIDFRKFTLKSNATLCFELYASDAVKFTIYSLNRKESKDTVSYSLKSLQTTTLKAGESKPTNSITLSAGDYYFSMQSTNAKKGGNASYSVRVSEFSVLPLDNAESCALSGAEETQIGNFTEDFPDILSSADEIAYSGLAAFSGADWSDLLIPCAAGSSGSPISESISDGLSVARTDNSALFTGLSSPDALSENDVNPGRDTTLLA